MRTKIRYVLLIGSALLLLSFLYLHSKLKSEDEFREREDADSTWKRKAVVAPDTKEDHIFKQAKKEDDNFQVKEWAKEPADIPGNLEEDDKDNEEEKEEDDKDEDSEAPSLDDEERAKVDAKNADILPRPDVVSPAEAEETDIKKDSEVVKVEKNAIAAPAIDVDPVANFHWNRKSGGGVHGVQNQIPIPKVTSGKCLPRTNITFLKVHKTGSSTVQNIFLRYGDLHSLMFVLPMMGHHLGYPNFFEKKHMLKTKDGMYNIFCHHTRFSNEVREVMPPNTLYISILRDPVKVFESSFTYFKLDWRMKMAGDKDAMKTFMSNPRKYYTDFTNKIHSRNSMLFDFGVPQTEFDNAAFIKRAISLIKDQFELVMIAEYFEESLLLMKDLLCWSMDDVIVFTQNSRNSDSVQTIDPVMRAKIQTWNSGDMLLYSFFNRTLWEKIDKYGRERMERDKAELKKRTQDLFSNCVATDTAPRDQGDFKVWQPPGVNINAFILKPKAKGNKLCESMVKPEIQYTMELKIKQFPDINFSQLKQKPKQPQNKGNPLMKRIQL